MKGTSSSRWKSLCLYYPFCRRSFTPSPLHNFRDGIFFQVIYFWSHLVLTSGKYQYYNLDSVTGIYQMNVVARWQAMSGRKLYGQTPITSSMARTDRGA